jgi:hypothetical protein
MIDLTVVTHALLTRTSIKRNVEVVKTGLGAGVLDDLASGIAWLANRLSQYGNHLRAGDIVLSGFHSTDQGPEWRQILRRLWRIWRSGRFLRLNGLGCIASSLSYVARTEIMALLLGDQHLNETR